LSRAKSLRSAGIEIRGEQPLYGRRVTGATLPERSGTPGELRFWLLFSAGAGSLHLATWTFPISLRVRTVYSKASAGISF
jgi:hypothetical protein